MFMNALDYRYQCSRLKKIYGVARPPDKRFR